MSSFTSDLIVKKIGDNKWELWSRFKYYVGEEGSADVIIVPKGTITDFASIPRLFWSILPPTGRYAGAALVHDYLYQEKSRPRKECDKIFLEAMKVLKVRRWKRYTMYWAVRAFGGAYYNS